MWRDKHRRPIGCLSTCVGLARICWFFLVFSGRISAIRPNPQALCKSLFFGTNKKTPAGLLSQTRSPGISIRYKITVQKPPRTPWGQSQSLRMIGINGNYSKFGKFQVHRHCGSLWPPNLSAVPDPSSSLSGPAMVAAESIGAANTPESRVCHLQGK